MTNDERQRQLQHQHWQWQGGLETNGVSSPRVFFFLFFSMFFFVYLFLYSINNYPEVLWTTAMSANASNMSNGLTAGLKTNHVSSPRVFFFLVYFLFYIILMAIYRYYERQNNYQCQH